MKNGRYTKVFALLATLTILISFTGYGQDDREERTPTMVKTFDLNQPGALNARSSGGGVVVRTHDQNEVIVQVYIRKNGRLLSPSDADIDDVLELYDLEINKNGYVITANVKRKPRVNLLQNTGISLTILTPMEMSCNVSSSGGGLKISGVKGTHVFSSSGGGVELGGVSGSTKASSSGGRVSAINQNGDSFFTSSGGGVTVDGAHGSVYARSSGGGVHLADINGDVEAGSSGGGVSVDATGGSVKATSSGGPVRVKIRNLSGEMYLQSSGGGVDAIIQNGEKTGLDLDISSSRVNIELNNFSGRAEKDRVKGTMNGGGIPVYMRSSGGNVKVSFE